MNKVNNLQIKGKLVIQNTKFTPTNGINPGYEKKGRALSYSITQDYIINKNFFFKEIIERLTNGNFTRNSISIFEPGCGPGKVTAYHLLGKKMITYFKSIYIECADLSNEMILLLNKYLKERELDIENSGSNINVNITSGISLIDLHYYKTVAKRGFFDVVLLSQFEHYFPNSPSSPLAQKLKKNNIPFITKDELIDFIYNNLLKENGILIIIDDEENQDPTIRNTNDDNWDRYVVIQLNKNIKKIRAINKEIADKIYKKYHSKGLKPKEIAAKTRIHRREQCNEEIRSLSDSIYSLKKKFGNAEKFKHNNRLLSRFYLIIAYKKSDWNKPL